MHPLIARYMDFQQSRQTLARQAEGAPLPPEEEAYARTAEAFPEAREVIREAEEKDADHPDVVEPLMLLAAHTAASQLEQDERLQPALQQARAALTAEGATPEQVAEFVATLLLEEAFGYSDEARDFDVDFVRASLGELPQLATLTTEKVEALEEAFRGPSPAPVRTAVVEALVENAWVEGPAFINPEHVLEALEEARGVVPKKERSKVLPTLRELLGFLETRGYVSAPRRARLEERLADAEG